MIRWLVILLLVALPLRSGMAAVQICPWMAAGLSAQAGSALPASVAIVDLGDDCAGMSSVDGTCALQAGCAATPLLPGRLKIIAPTAIAQHMPWHAVHSLFTYSPVPQRIPITRT
jgi:hypothetical protein